MRKKISIILLVLCILSNAITSFANPSYGQKLGNNSKVYEVKFNDVPKSHWAFNYISEMVERKIFSGYPDGLFRPDLTITRAEFAKIMVNAAQLKVDLNILTSGFSDVDNHWSKVYVSVAKPYLTGYINQNREKIYMPDAPALREDIAVAMVKLKGYDIKLADLSTLERMFNDYESISEDLRPYIAVAVEKGLMSGYENGTFRAQSSITRAEAATLLWRAFQYGNDNKVVEGDKPSVTPTPTPSPTPTPKPTVPDKVYAVDTLVESVQELTTMIVDNKGTTYYIDGDFVKSSDGNLLNTKTDFKFALGADNKNYDYKLIAPFLAYDEYNDKVYVVANDYKDSLIIFRLDNFKPVLVMNSKTNSKIYDEGIHIPNYNGYPDRYYETEFLSNGTMILYLAYAGHSSGGSGVLVNPNSNTISFNYLIETDYKVIGNKFYAIRRTPRDYYMPEFKVYDISNNLINTISIENKPSLSDNYSGYRTRSFGDKLYSWNNALICLDKEGYKKVLVDVNDIENLDLKPLSDSYENFAVDKSGNFIFYDKDSKSIRIIKCIKK